MRTLQGHTNEKVGGGGPRNVPPWKIIHLVFVALVLIISQ